MAKELKHFYRTVAANEGGKCHYPTRLDTYRCGRGIIAGIARNLEEDRPQLQN